MKIITLQRLTMDGEPVEYNIGDENGEDYTDWFCVIETEEEELVYDLFVESLMTSSKTTEEEARVRQELWNGMVNHAGIPFGLAWGDDDVFAYIRPDETYPDILGKYTDPEGDVWLRKE